MLFFHFYLQINKYHHYSFGHSLLYLGDHIIYYLNGVKAAVTTVPGQQA